MCDREIRDGRRKSEREIETGKMGRKDSEGGGRRQRRE